MVLLLVTFLYVVTYNPELLRHVDLDEKPMQVTLAYAQNDSGTIALSLTQGLSEYYGAKSRKQFCITACDPGKTEQKYLEDEKQIPTLLQLVEQIRQKSADPQTQARIAINLVQRIPYDEDSYKQGKVLNRYPYEVLYDNKALCGEKSRLLAYTLKELGFGVVMFMFDTHQAVGIKCDNFSFRNSGYCFVETTGPAMITNSQTVFPNVGLLGDELIIAVSDGLSFDASQDYADSQELKGLEQQARDGSLVAQDYQRMIFLLEKYGLQKTSCPQGATLCNGRCVGVCESGSLECSKTGPKCI